MAASLITVLIFCQLMSASADKEAKQMTARLGDDVTLPCEAPNSIAITRVEWIRSDMNKSVYIFQDGSVIPAGQDPSYKDRVQLKDDEMKNGDLSLVLKKVTCTDAGKYECRYVEKRGGRRQRRHDIINLGDTYLNVTANINVNGGLIATIAVLALAFAAFVIYTKCTARSAATE